MNLSRKVAYGLFLRSMRKDHNSFFKHCDRLEEVQTQILQDLLTRNASTEYFQSFSVDPTMDWRQFQHSVPICTYDNLLPWIERVAEGEKNVLTAESVRMFEPSSGSSAATKFIPYTDSLKRQFQRAIGPWISSLYAQWPVLTLGRAYWSVSPSTLTIKSKGVIPVGFEDDSEYLGQLGRWCAKRITVSPAQATVADDYLLAHDAALLACEDMTLISVWSPTFLLAMLERICTTEDFLLHRLCGQVSERRLTVIREAIQGQHWEKLWPMLACISCWADGPSQSSAYLMNKMFPCVKIQPKGLLATEAVVSIPVDDGDAVLAANSHWFEFLHEGSQIPVPAWQVEAGQCYRVLVTTGGGLYRYDLGDIVEITGWYHSLPRMKFVGKSSCVSDLCGEKLNAVFVQRCLQQLAEEGHLQQDAFAMLAPQDTTNQPMRYVLYAQAAEDEKSQAKLIARLEELLCDNYHYLHARNLGQLDPVSLFLLTSSRAELLSRYQARLARAGQKLGDIKFCPLSQRTGWNQTLGE